MTTIRTRCPNKENTEVDLTPADVTLTMPPDGAAHYAFECPLCHEVHTKEADEKMAALLKSAGVRLSDASLSLELETVVEEWAARLDRTDFLSTVADLETL